MKSLLRLLFANVKLRPARTALTALAVVASSCVIVWVVGGYDALLSQSVDEQAAKALGRFDVVFSTSAGRGGGPGGGPGRGGASTGASGGSSSARSKEAQPKDGSLRGGPPGGRRGGGGGPPGMNATPSGFAPEIIRALKDDPRVVEANRVVTTRSMTGKNGRGQEGDMIRRLIRGDRPPVNGAPPLTPTLNGTDALEAPYEMEAGRWLSPNPTEQPEAVMSADAAESLDVRVGDEIEVNTEAAKVVLDVVGLVEPPAATGESSVTQSGIFVTIPTASSIAGYDLKPSRVFVKLKEGTDAAAFRKDWTESLQTSKVSATLTDMQSLKESLAKGLSADGNLALAYLATAMSLMAALFIIFTTLSMGVTERARELAVLRAVGFTRGQVAGLIILEGLLLAVLGWLCGLGAGWLLLLVASKAQPELFANGARLGYWGFVLTGVAAFGGALTASILPAWKATRVQPLEAMVPISPTASARWVVPVALVGLGFLAINPLLTYLIPLARADRAWASAMIGYPSMVIGAVLLAPLVVLGVEKYLGPVVARLLALPPRLLSSLLSAHLWRTLGTTVALTVGLGLYLATQVWGYSMLSPFLPGKWVPEMMVGFEPSGLPDDQIDAVKHVPHVLPERVLPMAVEQPALASSVTAGKSAGPSLFANDNVVLLGVDPELAFGGSSPILDVDFMGDRAAAIVKLKAGKACLIPEHFVTMWGLKEGDSLELMVPNAKGESVAYEIVGVVSMPGWPWISKMSGIRRQAIRTGGMVFAPFDDVRRDFRLKGVNFFWFDTDGKSTPTQVEESMQAIAEAHGESRFTIAGVGELTSRRPYARLTATETVREGVVSRADMLIWGMSQLPLITLAITSLAVVNTVVSSVRARRWDMGILRSVGMTRWGLIRLVLAEAILIGLSVCLLGLGFAIVSGYCGTGMARYLSPFGGLETPLVLPWAQITLGFGTALGLCLLAALWPAIATGRAEPLSLLQAGRSTT